MIDGGDGDRGCSDLIECQQLLNRPERARSVEVGYLICASWIRIDDRRETNGKPLLCKLVIDTGMVLSERARSDHRDVKNAFTRQKKPLLYANLTSSTFSLTCILGADNNK